MTYSFNVSILTRLIFLSAMSRNTIPDDYEILRMPPNQNDFYPGSSLPSTRDKKDPLPHIPDKVDEDMYMQMNSIVTEIYPNELPPSGPSGGYRQPQRGYRDCPTQYRNVPYFEHQRFYNNDPHDPRARDPIYRDDYNMGPKNNRYSQNSYGPGTDLPGSRGGYVPQANMPVYSQVRMPFNQHPNYGYNGPAGDVPCRILPQPIRPDGTTIYRDPRYATYQVPSNQYPDGDMKSPDQLGAPDPNRNLPSGYEYSSVRVEFSAQDKYREMSNPYGTADMPLPHRGEQRPYRPSSYHDSTPEILTSYDSQANTEYPRSPLNDVSANLPPPRHPMYPQQRPPYPPQPHNDLPLPRFNRCTAGEEGPYSAHMYQQVRLQTQPGYPRVPPGYRPPVPSQRAQYESHERYHGGDTFAPPPPQYHGQVTPTYQEDRPQHLPPPILAPKHQQREWPSHTAHAQYPEEPNPANFPKPRLFPDMKDTSIEQVTGEFVHIQLAPAAPPSKPPRPRTPEPPGWKCPECTYHNKPIRPGCEMCTTPRPEDYVVPAGYKMDEEELNKQNMAKQHEVMAQERMLLEREKNYEQMMRAADQNLIEVDEEFECAICIVDVDVGDGVRLRECLHAFCRDCLTQHIMHADDAEVKCPFQGETYQCDSVVTEREIKQLLSPEAYSHWQQMGLNQAEGTIQNAFHCKSADCPGWCVYEDDINFFNCPVCNVQNCLTCKAIHQGKNCKEYQEEIKNKAQNDEDAKQTQKMLEDMIQQGEAMKCPQCHVIIQKKLGCDWIRCTVCKTEICWATKGLRWGPKGKGDTSGGCKCRADGRTPCCPQCKNCH